MYFTTNITRMDPSLSNFTSNLKLQETNKKISNFEAVGKGNLVVPMDVIPANAPAAPMVNQKRG